MEQLASFPSAPKLKLFCRFDGDFHPEPPYNELSYIGGETKVFTVDKNFSFLQLVTIICQVCPNLNSYCVKYKLVWSDSDFEMETPLVSIECDDDVKSMVEEFDEEVELCEEFGVNLSIWLFVEKESSFCGRNVNGSECSFDFGFPLVDLSSELSNECCGSGKLSKDESFLECCLNLRDENSISERNGLVHCVSRQSNVECNGLSSSRVGGVNGEQELWSNGDIREVLVDTLLCEVESPALSSLVWNDFCNNLLESENHIDDGEVHTSPKSEKSATITFDYVFQGGLNIEKESTKGSKVIGGISNDLAELYAHLAANELPAIKHSDLEFKKELGSGAYGTVYHGKWKGSDIAIKKLKPSCFTSDSLEENRPIADFWKEAHLLSQLHHPNIVAFHGVVTDGPANNLAMVTEYMVNGSLRQVLKRNDRTIDRRKRLLIAMDAAIGMEYMHEKNIVHFDFKSHNLLVNMKDPKRPICKIGDLGLSKIKRRSFVPGGMRGTVPWMAPELLNSKGMVNEKVDVYSFGVVMWELLTGEAPYADLKSEEIIAGIINDNLRPEIPSWIDPTWRSLMERCWSSNPDERPAVSEIVKELRAMAVAMNIK